MSVIIDDPALLIDPHRLKQIRRSRGYTYREVSALSGVCHKRLVLCENGETGSQTLKSIKRLCVALQDNLGVDMGLLDRLLDYQNRFSHEKFDATLRRLGIKMAWIAVCLDISQTTISLWRKGVCRPDGLRIVKIADILKVDAEVFLM